MSALLPGNRLAAVRVARQCRTLGRNYRNTGALGVTVVSKRASAMFPPSSIERFQHFSHRLSCRRGPDHVDHVVLLLRIVSSIAESAQQATFDKEFMAS